MNISKIVGGVAQLTDVNTTADSSTATAMQQLMEKIAQLVNAVYPYLLIGVALIVLVWGIYIGVRIAIAHKNEDQINSRGMIKNLVIGVLVMFIVMIAVPLLMNALCAWAGVDGITFSDWFSFVS